jgi:hypothetical protein
MINSNYLALGCAFCYVSKALTPLQTVRYMKHTCTLTKLHILARYSKYEVITFFNLSLYHYNLHDKQICTITGSIPNDLKRRTLSGVEIKSKTYNQFIIPHLTIGKRILKGKYDPTAFLLAEGN